jgi:glucose-6-phosphate isomerase
MLTEPHEVLKQLDPRNYFISMIVSKTFTTQRETLSNSETKWFLKSTDDSVAKHLLPYPPILKR